MLNLVILIPLMIVASIVFLIGFIIGRKDKKDNFFFGWENFKWFFKEVLKIYSNRPSVFSKKRMESGSAYTIAQYGMMVWFATHVISMSVTDLLLWAGAEFLICGYNIYQTQKEKKLNTLIEQPSA